MDPTKKTPINNVIDIVASNGYGREAVKVTTPSGTPILSKDALAFEKKNYYDDVPKMKLVTILREPDPDRIPQMTTKQLRILSDKLYFTKTDQELTYLFEYLNENRDFPKLILHPRIEMLVDVLWQSRAKQYRPTRLFDIVIPEMITDYHLYEGDDDEDDLDDFDDLDDLDDLDDYISEWQSRNERKFFENVYRVLIKPRKNNPNSYDPYHGGKITRTKRRKTRKSIKKRNTKRRNR
jgi:hypothetical protein